MNLTVSNQSSLFTLWNIYSIFANQNDYENKINTNIRSTIMKERSLFNNEKGLYNFSYEHDACGVGMLVNIHGGKSHEIVESALKVLENM